MSTISAGLTTGTALVSSGDTTGQLVFQTNGTTTALTLGTNQSATFAGAANFTSSVQLNGSAGTSGQVLTSAGVGAVPTWQSVAAFASGTTMLFVQTSAPTGWTKSTAHNNKALRVVSGAASSGGTVAFTTAFTSQAVNGTVGSTTLTTSQIPSHRHYVTNSGSQYTYGSAASTGNANGYGWYTDYEGGGGSHNHSFSGTAIDLAVQYVDVIIAVKD